MVNLFVLSLCLTTVVTVLAEPTPSSQPKYDIDAILANEEKFNIYYKCLMDQGDCTPEGAELKRLIPDALNSGCSSCTEKQKEDSKKVFKFMIQNKPEQWAALEQKYDPTGSYKAKYLAAASSTKAP